MGYSRLVIRPETVIPAKAGIQNRSLPQYELDAEDPWIPAFAGMTEI